MTQASDIGDVKITLAEQVVVLRETKHLVANMATKLDALGERVIALGNVPGEISKITDRVTEVERRVDGLERDRDLNTGKRDLLGSILKSPALGWLVGAAVTAWAILTGKV